MDEQIRNHLISLLVGRESLTDFEDWFLPITWASESQVASEIRLRLAEHELEHLDDEEFLAALLPLVGDFTQVSTGTGNESVTPADARDLVAA